jgi:hypothetical protein
VVRCPRHGVVSLVIKVSSFVVNSNHFQTFLKLRNSIFVEGVKPVSSVHLQLTLGHLLGFLDLHGTELDSVVVATACGRTCLSLGSTLILLLIVRRLLSLRLLLISTILRRDLTLHQANRVTLKLFAYLFFFSLPLILQLGRAVPLVFREAGCVSVLGALSVVKGNGAAFW